LWDDLVTRLKNPPGSESAQLLADAKAFATWRNLITALAVDLSKFNEKQIIDMRQFKEFDDQWANSATPERKKFWQNEVEAIDGSFHAATEPLLPRFTTLRTLRGKNDLPTLAALI